MGRKLFLFALILLSFCSATIADIYVIELGMSYPTLKAAVTAAGTIATPTVPATVFLDPGLYNLQNTSSLDINVPANVKIMGCGPDSTVIDCNLMGRAFKLKGSGITISDLTITRGFTQGPIGVAGVEPGKGDPNGQNSKGHGYGGAIIIDSGNVSIENCAFENCLVAGAVGGLAHKGIDGNSTSNNGKTGYKGGIGKGEGLGGAIYVANGRTPVTIIDCNFLDNTAEGGIGGRGGMGGNAFNSAGHKAWGGNGGDGDGNGLGAAIYVGRTVKPQIIRCAFSNNKAKKGVGGIGGAVSDVGTNTSPVVGKGTDGNSLGQFGTGGAIFADVSSEPNFVDCTFTSNTANRAGAIMAISSSKTKISGSQFNKSTSSNWSGGAIRCDANSATSTTLTLNNVAFNTNSCTGGSGGGAVAGFNTSITAANTSFSCNTSDWQGGAVYTVGGNVESARFDKCIFGNSVTGTFSPGNGGALSINFQLNVDINDCSFSDNDSPGYGGAVYAGYTGNFVKITRSNFIKNSAQSGGGLMTSSSAIDFNDLKFISNSCTGQNAYGGGYYCSGIPSTSTNNQIINSKFDLNTATGVANASGGAMDFKVANSVKIQNCLITNNVSNMAGGGIAAESFSVLNVYNVTISDNIAVTKGGGIFCSSRSMVHIWDSIFRTCTQYGIYEDSTISDIDAANTIFYQNKPFNFFNEGTTNVDTDPQFRAVSGFVNIDVNDPSFKSSSLGDYYLATDANNPNIHSTNKGSRTAVAAGVSTKTTCVDNSLDVGIVDIGYHYPNSNTLPKFTLTLSPGPHGTVTASGGPTYYQGDIVTLTAIPEFGYRIKQWYGGTSNDLSKARTNTVVMVSNRVIRVEFDTPETWHVGEGADLFTIQNAIDSAAEGDIVEVGRGTFRGSVAWDPNSGDGLVVINKNLVVKSTSNDPCQTILNPGGYANNFTGVVFGPNAGSDTIFSGFTIDHATDNKVGKAPNGTNPGDDGADGMWTGAAGMYFAPGSKPLILNTIVQNAEARAQSGGDGTNSGQGVNAGRGGWGGAAYGAGIYVDVGASPIFKNVRVANCLAQGGDGGKGGDQPSTDSGAPNYGGSWSGKNFRNVTPTSIYMPTRPLWQEWGYVNDFRFYSAYGGGVFCDTFSQPVFENCQITGNRVIGGMSGQGGHWVGDGYEEPVKPFKIPAYGAGVYIARGAKAIFRSCLFADNEAQADNNSFKITDYIAYGGGVCSEDNNSVFTNCTFSGNKAQTGGAMFQDHAIVDIVDCNFIRNSAVVGGGMDIGDSDIKIVNTTLLQNSARTAHGGGISLTKSDALVADCVIANNDCNNAGGGIFIAGAGVITTINNCLITGNTAKSDGGGISASTWSQPTIRNCTFSGNQALGDTNNVGFGGAVSTKYNAHAVIINSILYNDFALTNGSELAVLSGFNSSSGASQADVNHCDIRSGGVYADTNLGCKLNWLSGNLYGSAFVPRFVDGYHLNQTPAELLSAPLSPCINAGIGDANSLPLGYWRYTTSTDATIRDSGIIDMGYHYRKPGAFVQGDLNYDGEVTLADLNLLIVSNWLRMDCELPDYCFGADLNQDSVVNIADQAILAMAYGNDKMAPVPNPSTWAIKPAAVTGTTDKIFMSATRSFDNSGRKVSYRVDYRRTDTVPPEPNVTTGWQLDDPNFTISGLASGGQYEFAVQASDDVGNMTIWSKPPFSARTGEDTSAPSPCAWNLEPYQNGTYAISMSAAAATDISGVSYRFLCTTDTALNSQLYVHPAMPPAYTVNGLIPGATYCFKLRVEDDLGNWAETTPVCVTLGVTPPPPAEDHNAPVFSTDCVTRITGSKSGGQVTATVSTATDDSGEVWYQMAVVSGTRQIINGLAGSGGQIWSTSFDDIPNTDNDSNPNNNDYGTFYCSPWQQSNVFFFYAGTVEHGYVARAKDKYGNVTPWCPGGLGWPK